MSANKSGEKSSIAAGILAALALTAVFCGIYALLIKHGKCGREYSDIIISAAIALSIFIGGIISVRGRGRGGAVGLMTGVIYAAVLTAVPLLAYPTEVDWLKIVRIFAISGIGGFLGARIIFVKSDKSFRKSRKKRP